MRLGISRKLTETSFDRCIESVHIPWCGWASTASATSRHLQAYDCMLTASLKIPALEQVSYPCLKPLNAWFSDFEDSVRPADPKSDNLQQGHLIARYLRESVSLRFQDHSLSLQSSRNDNLNLAYALADSNNTPDRLKLLGTVWQLLRYTF